MEQEKIQFKIREYFKDSLSMDEIDHLIDNIGVMMMGAETEEFAAYGRSKTGRKMPV